MDAGKVKTEGTIQLFYSDQMSGVNAGQQTVGVKASVDTSFVTKENIIVNTPQVQVKTSIQTKVGGSLLWYYQWSS